MRLDLTAAMAALVLGAGPALATGLTIDVEGEASGQITIDLFEDVAPQHVAQITALAAEGAYDGVVFHRVIDGFMAQTGDVQFGRTGGDMRRAGMGKSERPNVPAEFSDMPFDRGVVGMARSSDPNSANSQFFIMFDEGHFLNGQYTVVGKVTEGMDVVDAIKRGEGPNGAVIGQPDAMAKVQVTE
ncbi:peptidylprolyl isomerase [Arenibacterium halophilum]|uniref:Peptidyl-prolyl cis-trans isomerase n=1 Tax=Arenibacterium halophilum TaxID=2583821 RepID=A0ABY2XCW2_9RHOB|nr:peptidylprolyl isomerase [Arenibacterium halophilum]TMV14536.1 peptidylprolyl isomerase [Arenibacterium halophilum]